jgi:hypothetical protein
VNARWFGDTGRMMRPPLVRIAILCATSIWCASARPARAETVATITSAPPPHANPRLKASYRLFSLAGLEGAPMWLHGAQLDVYALSRRWARLGFELEGGGGDTRLVGTPARLSYGLGGLTAAVQYPARVTPFLEGRFVAGVLSGQLDGALTIGGASLGGSSATAWAYGGGLETGAEIYVYRRVYLSAALGWMRTTWHGVDVATTMQHPTAGIAYKDLVGDTVTLKLGCGI